MTDLQIEILQKRILALREEINILNAQWESTLSEVDRLRIRKEIDRKLLEIEENEQLISRLSSQRELNFISTYDKQAIKEYVRRHAEYSSSRAPGEKNIHYAVKQWLLPNMFDVGNFDELLDKSKYERAERYQFVDDLRTACADFAQTHPQLEKWIWSRIALLERIIHDQNGISADILDAAIVQNTVLLEATKLHFANKSDESKHILKEILLESLSAAAYSVARILGPKIEQCDIWANLMLPLTSKDLNSPIFEDFPKFAENRSISVDLWKDAGLLPKKMLLVLAQTKGDTDLIGFWVPTYGATSIMPGAPFAFECNRGNAVFLDDIPPFPQKISSDCYLKWKDHMREYRHSYDLFVSIPYILPTGKGENCCAVLNVNVNLTDETTKQKGWRRAYHREWLAEATLHAKLPLHNAYRSCLLLYSEFFS